MFAVNLRAGSKMLELHGVLYLVAAALASGFLPHALRMFFGALPANPGWPVYAAALTAIAAYAIAREREGEDWLRQVLHFAAAFLATLATSALLARIMVTIAVAIAPATQPIPFLRTLTLCLIALALAYAGPRLHRVEMTRLAYAALIFVAAKLLLEDLPHAPMAFIAASIFLFAVTLISVPRLGHAAKRG